MLNRISDVHKLHEVVQYYVTKRSKPVVITPVICDNGITLEYTVGGELIAEERKLTAVMAEQVWHNRYKSDHCWVATEPFQAFARDMHWTHMNSLERWAAYRKYNYVMAEVVRDERTVS